jgi:hypothetical protein
MKGVYMNKFFAYAAFVAFFAITVPAQAQTADETAAPAEAPVVEAPVVEAPVVTAPVVTAPTTTTNLNENPINKIMRECVPLRVRQEQDFDANGNNFLEPNEVKAFLKNVYQDTSNGPVKNTSDILYYFDKNKDGYIDRGEASGFSSYSL